MTIDFENLARAIEDLANRRTREMLALLPHLEAMMRFPAKGPAPEDDPINVAHRRHRREEIQLIEQFVPTQRLLWVMPGFGDEDCRLEFNEHGDEVDTADYARQIGVVDPVNISFEAITALIFDDDHGAMMFKLRYSEFVVAHQAR